MRRVLLIANPISGGGRNLRRADVLARALKIRGIESDLKTTNHRGHAIEIASAASKEGAHETVIGIGGDGTLREIAEGLDGKLPAAVFPSGTANVLARELRIPFAAEGFARVVEQRRVARIDTALCNGRRTLFSIGVGFDANILRELESVRRGGISYLNYALPILKTLQKFKPSPLFVTADGSPPTDCGFVIISNTRYYAGPWIRFKSGPLLDDGLFEIYCFRAKSAFELVRALLRGVAGRLPGKNVIFMKGRAISVESAEATPIQIDGDVAGTTPAAVAVERRSMPILVGSDSPAAADH
ncbi:MAG: hypothetical protein HY286_15560 [Planctomycetes bacterium]|nr:hypothetical protein [Planctomycetota bacterium]